MLSTDKHTNKQTDKPMLRKNIVSSLGLFCSNLYESNTALCTYWIPEIVEPTSSNKLKKVYQE